MNTLRHTTIFCCLLACCFVPTMQVQAALPIDLEIVTEPGTPISGPQEWSRLLGRMDLGTVRVRGSRAGDRPKLEQKQQGKTTRYRLLAILNSRNELVLPERRFRLSDQRALQKHLEQLPAQAAYTAEERGRFGLTEKQFRLLYAELSQPVGFSTVGKTPQEVLAKIKKNLRVPVVVTHRTSLRNSKPLAVELQKFSTGTALAIALRPAGLSLCPEQLPGQPLRISIEPYKLALESWPIGWKPAVSSRRSAPQLYELRNIEIGGFTLNQTLTALQPAIKLPVIMDEWILEQQQIDPEQVQVSLPKKRTFLKSALSKLLSQARLAQELRVDEQEQPFLWITRFGKDSRPATK